MNDRLYRSRSERMLAGVAGGVADRFDLDPSFVRIAWAILTILSGGIFLLIYIVMAIVVPEEPVGGSAGGWSAAGSAGWSTNWSVPSSPLPEPAAPPVGETPSTGSTDPFLAPSAPTTGSAGPIEPGTGPTAAPGFAAPGFAAPVVAGWIPPGPGGSNDSGWPSRRAARDARRAARRAERGFGSDHPGVGAIVGGLILVGLGLYFLIRTVAPRFDLDPYWPAGLLVLGVVLLALSIRRTPGGTTP
ncbi:MAG TPA: PspC domain-containing protein [Verrucomicrobiae bacterium]|nr:PspC domain-containing protein [Verrucomicrobiae bacterium]